MLKRKSAQAALIVVTLLSSRIGNASVVVFSFGKRTVFVAADSRETYGDGTFKDTACKIGSYGNSVVFTHVGISSFGIADLMAEARNAVAIASFATIAPHSIAEQSAVTWKDSAAKLLGLQGAEQLLAMTRLNGSPELAAFMFANIEGSGNISIWYATVTLTSVAAGVPILEAKAQQYGVDGDDEVKLRALGHDQIVWEYVRATTDRAKAWRKEVEGGQPSTQKVQDKIEATATRLVELTIKNDSQGVGGSIDQLRLEVGKGVEWIRRKPECGPSGERVRPDELKPIRKPGL